MPRLLITGGLGFIGHHLCAKLKSLGHAVTPLDNFSHNVTQPFHRRIVDERLKMLQEAGITVVKGDILDLSQLEAIMMDCRPDKIIHCSAIPSVQLSDRDPSAAFNQNLSSTKNILEIIRRRKLPVRQFIYFSSSMVYGDFEHESVAEDAPKEPKNIYGAVKRSSELLIKAYHNLMGLPYTIVRPSALYGPRCINNRVTQVFIESALRNSGIRIEGDGTQKLDFTYIDDLVEGVALLCDHEAALNEIFNITRGHAEPIGRLVEILGDYFKDLKVDYAPWNRLMPRRGTLQTQRIRALGFRPRYDLDTGYRKYVDWYLKNDVLGLRI